MKVHSLKFSDFSDNNYTLIGIHCALEDYRLAFLLNYHLKTNFARAEYDLDFKNKNSNSSYSIYEYSNKNGSDWFLISNICKTQIESVGLFNKGEITTFLIPEKKKVDFFIKVEGDITNECVLNSLEKINEIPQIFTSYTINPKILKSKDFLIF